MSSLLLLVALIVDLAWLNQGMARYLLQELSVVPRTCFHQAVTILLGLGMIYQGDLHRGLWVVPGPADRLQGTVEVSVALQGLYHRQETPEASVVVLGLLYRRQGTTEALVVVLGLLYHRQETLEE